MEQERHNNFSLHISLISGKNLISQQESYWISCWQKEAFNLMVFALHIFVVFEPS